MAIFFQIIHQNRASEENNARKKNYCKLSVKTSVTIMCRNDELSWLFTNKIQNFYIIFRK